MQPAVVLADEPTGNLDRSSGKDVIEILENLNEAGMTLIMVTHDPELGGRAGRRIQMVDGQIISDTRAGLPDESA
jgi:putative ABC transport system ATP-binding protein